MRKKILFFLLNILLFLFATQASAKVRIAYIEGSDYFDYPLILKATIEEMGKLGLLEEFTFELPENFSSKQVWDFAAKNTKSDQVEFVADAFYNLNTHDDISYGSITKLVQRVEIQKDIDLIFAFGTQAGVEVVNNIYDVNIMNFSSANPILAGISNSSEDSGSDYIHAIIEPNIYYNQLALFYSIFQFKTLGICYEDSLDGQAIISYNQILEAAKNYNFTLVEGKMPIEANPTKSIQARVECHQSLSNQVDAMYLTFGLANEENYMLDLLAPLMDKQIPTFSQSGPAMVKNGALLSMASSDFGDIGLFEALVVKQIVEGKKPREINQIYAGNTKLTLNITMAYAISWNIPFELLLAVDKIYEDITNTVH